MNLSKIQIVIKKRQMKMEFCHKFYRVENRIMQKRLITTDKIKILKVIKKLKIRTVKVKMKM